MNRFAPDTCPPLSWEDVRFHLMEVIRHYDHEVNDKSVAQSQNVSHAYNTKTKWYLKRNVDMWITFLFSTCLLVLGLYNFVSISNKENDGNARIYMSQIVAGSFAMLLSIFSIVLSWKRQKTSKHNRDVGLRRSLKSFASFLSNLASKSSQIEWDSYRDKMYKETDMESNRHKRKYRASNSKRPTNIESLNTPPIRLSGGTSLTDIYPVYRRKSISTSNQGKDHCNKSHKLLEGIKGDWHRVSKLLLVKGDYVALQVGDTTPAKVELANIFDNTDMNGNSEKKDLYLKQNQQKNISRTLEGGERITLDAMQKLLQKNLPSKKNSLLGGRRSNPKKVSNNSRIQLEEESTQLLSLNNEMKIFILKESPLKMFLERINPTDHKSPQIHRQIQAVRLCLIVCAATTFALVSISVGIRIAIQASNDLMQSISVIIHIPFLATLGVLPLFSPILIYLIEIIGTARILTFIHPFTAQHKLEIYHPLSVSEQNMMFLKYCIATMRSRFFSIRYPLSSFKSTNSPSESSSSLLPIPPANSYFLEKLGVVTALALIDDELVCEPHSTPQQLLIPSEHGLKLLDLYPSYDDDNDEEDLDFSETNNAQSKSKRDNSFSSDLEYDSDDSDLEINPSNTSSAFQARKRFLAFKGRKSRKRKLDSVMTSNELRQILSGKDMDTGIEVQFEDPSWWKFLPSLKCIGLACLLVDFNPKRKKKQEQHRSIDDKLNTDEPTLSCTGSPTYSDQEPQKPPLAFISSKLESSSKSMKENGQNPIISAESSLVQHICRDQSRSQLLALARCIGFSDDPRTGDVALFKERRRIHIISTQSLQKRMALDTHAVGLEQSRLWDVFCPDSTSVVIQYSRSKAYQLLTVGDAHTVTNLCADTWLGENSTISPLNAVDRQLILNTCNNWSMADLDVTAFSYAPVPFTLEQRIGGIVGKSGFGLKTTSYLVDHLPKSDVPSYTGKDLGSPDWSLVSNQIFLGMLGSSVSPRKDTAVIIEQCNSAGVRFVYFSPRNMRRTKELASQMGIDVAWNCAISLRALDDGEEDPYRMKSDFKHWNLNGASPRIEDVNRPPDEPDRAPFLDWVVNARLPHGIENVKRHLEEVDNVPLLVSLYTDVTESTTNEMIDVFKKYHDTVLVLGLSHRSRNERTFSAADLSIGVDIIGQEIQRNLDQNSVNSKNLKNEQNSKEIDAKIFTDFILPTEVEFVSSLVSHSCMFNLLGCSTMVFLPKIISNGRAALESATAAGLFIINGGLSLSLLIFFSTCSISTHIAHVSSIGSILYLTLLLPILGITISLSETDADSMDRVPEKNDVSQVFTGRGEFKRLHKFALLRALPSPLLAALTHVIVFKELLYEVDADFIATNCTTGIDSTANLYEKLESVNLIGCKALSSYRGVASTSAGSLMLAQMATCVVFTSIGFVQRANSIITALPRINITHWVVGILISIMMIILFLVATLEHGVLQSLPWYFFILFSVSPILCVVFGEWIKRYDRKHERRAVAFRRLKFETRLGAWSPK